jgi:hypothetical protein
MNIFAKIASRNNNLQVFFTSSAIAAVLCRRTAAAVPTIIFRPTRPQLNDKRCHRQLFHGGF